MKLIFKQNLFEKFGDMYSKYWFRFLFWICIAIINIIVGYLVTPNTYFIAVYCFYGFLSFFENNKIKYVKSIEVKLPNGEVASCALFKQKLYAFAPLILAFFSIGYYIPYKTQYILVPHMESENLPNKKKITTKQKERLNIAALSSGLLNTIIIPKSKFVAIINDPQIISDELYELSLNWRETFLTETKAFIDTGIMEEIYHTNSLSICKMFDETTLLFHYSSCSESQSATMIHPDIVEKIKQDESFILDSYLKSDEIKVYFFTKELLERLLLVRERIYSKNTETQTADKPSDKESEAKNRFLKENLKSKQIFTKETIISGLKSKYYTRNMICGCFFLFISIYGLIGLIYGVFNCSLGIAAISFILFTALIYFGVKKVKTAKSNLKKLHTGEYRIVKVTCTDIVDNSNVDEGVVYHNYIHHFSNGSVIYKENTFAVTGDQVYLVYFNNEKTPQLHYNSIQFVPSTDLTIEEYQPTENLSI